MVIPQDDRFEDVPVIHVLRRATVELEYREANAILRPLDRDHSLVREHSSPKRNAAKLGHRVVRKESPDFGVLFRHRAGGDDLLDHNGSIPTRPRLGEEPANGKASLEPVVNEIEIRERA
jgi:hypothetical protein